MCVGIYFAFLPSNFWLSLLTAFKFVALFGMLEIIIIILAKTPCSESKKQDEDKKDSMCITVSPKLMHVIFLQSLLTSYDQWQLQIRSKSHHCSKFIKALPLLGWKSKLLNELRGSMMKCQFPPSVVSSLTSPSLLNSRNDNFPSVCFSSACQNFLFRSILESRALEPTCLAENLISLLPVETLNIYINIPGLNCLTCKMGSHMIAMRVK